MVSAFSSAAASKPSNQFVVEPDEEGAAAAFSEDDDRDDDFFSMPSPPPAKSPKCSSSSSSSSSSHHPTTLSLDAPSRRNYEHRVDDKSHRFSREPQRCDCCSKERRRGGSNKVKESEDYDFLQHIRCKNDSIFPKSF